MSDTYRKICLGALNLQQFVFLFACIHTCFRAFVKIQQIKYHSNHSKILKFFGSKIGTIKFYCVFENLHIFNPRCKYCVKSNPLRERACVKIMHQETDRQHSKIWVNFVLIIVQSIIINHAYLNHGSNCI